jgi:predicted nuclease of predicted toxin-antitoxin system
VKLLFDQNLSWRLVGHVRDAFPESVHVTSEGLATATDDEIWAFAGAKGFVVVSKDPDFRQLAFLHGPPPKVVWFRVGNASTVEILEVILDYVEAIKSFIQSEDEALLVLPPQAIV